jgi:heptosyltransferase I
VVRTLQAAWPDARITWIVGRTEHGLLAGIDGVDFITFDKSAPNRSLLAIRRALSGRRFDVLLHMHASMRANLVSLQVAAGRRIGFDRARARDWQWLFTREQLPPTPRQHVMDGLFEFAEYLGVTERKVRWGFAVSAADGALARELATGTRPLCVISPCTSSRFRNYRNWSVANYVAVARHLVERHGARIVITGGPTATERDYGAALATALGGAAVNLVGKTSLKQLFAILEVADLLLCPDSGPAHLATAAGIPVVGLYATSNRLRTGPYFSQELVADAYPEAVRQEFGCAVSELRWGARVRNPAAMELITVPMVIGKLDAALTRAPGIATPATTPPH